MKRLIILFLLLILDLVYAGDASDRLDQLRKVTKSAIDDEPSFLCSKASTPVEKLICSSKDLSRADQVMVNEFKTANSVTTDSKAFRSTQSLWRNKIRDICKDVDCLYSAYTKRIVELSNIYEQYNRSSFPLGSHGGSGTITSIQGVNTANAVATGKVSYVNSKESCLRDAGYNMSDAELDKCISEDLKRMGNKQFNATANCPGKRILTSHLGEFTFTKKGNEDVVGSYVFKNIHTGNILDGSSASGAPIVEDQFRMLCPAFIS